MVKKAEATLSASISLALIIAVRSSREASSIASTELASTVVAPLTPLTIIPDTWCPTAPADGWEAS